jgi:hypothetical protein
MKIKELNKSIKRGTQKKNQEEIGNYFNQKKSLSKV